ncbi:MAG: outer membrane beta-barrel protein [Thermoanaerobaculia bacterium]
MRHRPILFTAVVFAAVKLTAFPVQAEGFKLEYQPRVELFVSSLFATSATEGSFGLRGSLRVRNRFHVEASVSRLNGRVDLFLIDFSAKYYLRDRRTDLYLVAGPGLFYSSDLDADELMLHFGFGAEFTLGRRLYLRPEIRGRWLAEDLDAGTIGDLAVGLGWRF